MKRPNALIRASTLVGFDDLVRRSGQDTERLMASAGLSPLYLREQELYLPFQRFVKLLELTASATGNPFFGAELGFQQGIRVFGSIGYAISTSATVGDALDTMLHHYSLQTTGVMLRLDRFGSKAMLSADIVVPTPLGARQIMGQLCACGTEIMRLFLGRNWKADEVHLAHAVAGLDRRRYHQLFGEDIRFDAAKTALVFEAKVLSIPLPDADPALHDLIERQINALSLQSVEDLVPQVEATIRNAMPQGDVSLETIAKALAMSPRSLQRHLGDSGTTFQELLDGVRWQAAEHYLLNSSLQLTQIAELLGFRALSNFSHAFRRWQGVSPRQWKQSRS